METKTCSMCNIEKHNEEFHKKDTESKIFNKKKLETKIKIKDQINQKIL